MDPCRQTSGILRWLVSMSEYKGKRLALAELCTAMSAILVAYHFALSIL